MKKRRNPDNVFLSSAQMAAVVKKFLAKAAKNEVRAAICGGLAMQLYGSDRLTKDIDFVADELLADRPAGTLSFGGVKYEAAGTVVDWIVRDDDQAFVYEAALDERTKTKEGFWILRPEWMALIKLLARRPKDESDLLYLLGTPGLVDRSKVRKNIRSLFGRGAFATQDEMDSAMQEADWKRAKGL